MKIKLHYEEKGTGQPMVLLHGNGEDSSYFTAQIDYFSKKYRVIAIDTRGHGKSERGTAPFTLRQFAEDLKQFLDEMELRRIILLGFSDGGNIALIFTILHPQYVDKLILNGANLNPFGMKAGVCRGIYTAYFKACLREMRGEQKSRKGCMTENDSYLLERSKRKKELLQLMVKEPRIRPVYLKTMRKPVLVIAGTRDMIRTGHTKKIHRLIPGSRLCLLNGTHFIASENSLEFNQEVDRFLEGGAGRTGTDGNRTAGRRNDSQKISER